MRIQGIIFDLDGVICFTDEYHYQAWKTIADKENIIFNREINNLLRGVSRKKSLEIILKNSTKEYSEKEKEALCNEKNEIYKSLLENMTPSDVSIEVRYTLKKLKQKGIKIAIGSSSKNTMRILNKIELIDEFDAIADGTMVLHSKPNPEVFLLAASKLGIEPKSCMVVEDAKSGIDAAFVGGFIPVAISDAIYNPLAKYRINFIDSLLDLLKEVDKNE